MKFAIVEDEIYAYKELKRMLEILYPQSEILGHFDSVKSAINGLPDLDVDLIFFDISLPDGFSFDILNSLKLETPIIFTTAYDEYALKAYKYNSVDYLLKPIDQNELKNSIDKFINLKKKLSSVNLDKIDQLLSPKSYKNRFLVKVGDQYSYVKTEDIAYFFSEEKTTHIKTIDNHTYIIDHSLNDLEEQLDSKLFFRISRSIICSIISIKSSSKYFNSRLKLELNPDFNEEVLISRIKVKPFLDWLDQ